MLSEDVKDIYKIRIIEERMAKKLCSPTQQSIKQCDASSMKNQWYKREKYSNLQCEMKSIHFIWDKSYEEIDFFISSLKLSVNIPKEREKKHTNTKRQELKKKSKNYATNNKRQFFSTYFVILLLFLLQHFLLLPFLLVLFLLNVSTHMNCCCCWWLVGEILFISFCTSCILCSVIALRIVW